MVLKPDSHLINYEKKNCFQSAPFGLDHGPKEKEVKWFIKTYRAIGILTSSKAKIFLASTCMFVTHKAAI